MHLPTPRWLDRDARSYRFLVGALSVLIVAALVGIGGLLAFGGRDNEPGGGSIGALDDDDLGDDAVGDDGNSGDGDDGNGGEPQPGPVVVPSVLNLSAADAVIELRLAGFNVERRLEENANVEPDIVVGQEPAPGGEAEAGSTVVLVVSKAAETKQIPPLQGLTQTQAEAALSDIGLRSSATEIPSDSVTVGQVVRSDPSEGQEVNVGSQVQLLISRGPDIPEVAISDVAGQDLASAGAVLEEAGFSELLSEEESSLTVPMDAVIRTSPTAGSTLRVDQPVTIVVSTGPPLVTVPGLNGRSRAAAEAELLALDLVPEFIPDFRPADDRRIGLVVGPTTPSAGESLPVGSSVVVPIATAFELCPVRSVSVRPAPMRVWALKVDPEADREFGGNAIKVTMFIRSIWDDNRIDFHLSMRAEGLGGENTAGSGGRIDEVFTARSGEKIINVTQAGRPLSRNGPADSGETIDEEHGAEDVPGSGLVSNWRVVADTSGNDIGNNNGDDDANVTATFRSIEVELEDQTGDCTPR